MFCRREALEVWKQKHGSSATYHHLFHVFKHAGYEDYAEKVRQIIGKAYLIYML
jgi:hypothetical protein